MGFRNYGTVSWAMKSYSLDFWTKKPLFEIDTFELAWASCSEVGHKVKISAVMEKKISTYHERTKMYNCKIYFSIHDERRNPKMTEKATSKIFQIFLVTYLNPIKLRLYWNTMI